MTERNETQDAKLPTVAELPPLEERRRLCDARIKAKGIAPTRAQALRVVDMSQSTYERCLKLGVSWRNDRETHRKLRMLGVLDVLLVDR